MKQTILLGGFYEQKNRNPLVGALLLVIIVGALYFAIGGIVSQITLTVSKSIDAFKSISSKKVTYPQLPPAEGNNNTADEAAPRAEAAPQSDRVLGGKSREDGQNDSSFVVDTSIVKYPTLILTAIFQFFIMLPLTLALGKRWFTRNIDVYMGYRNFSLSGVIAGALLGLAIIPLATFIGDYFYNLFPGIKKLAELSSGILSASSKLDLLFIIVVIGVTPAVCEEALFRGIFLRTLTRKLPAWLAILASSLLFTLFHSSILSLPSIFIAGLSLGFTYWAFESIYASIALHFCYNTGLVLITNNVWKSAELLTADDGSMALPSLGVSMLLISGIVLFMYAERKTARSKSVIFAKAIGE